MWEDITFGPKDLLWGTPEGNQGILDRIECGGDPARAYFSTDLPWLPTLTRVSQGVYRGVRDGSNFLTLWSRLVSPEPLIRSHAHLDDPGAWVNGYGVADDEEQALAYLAKFAAHPTRRFFVFLADHMRHQRQGTSLGAVISAVAGKPVPCAIRWRKTGPYVGTRFDPDDPPHEYLCDEDYDRFTFFHVCEWVGPTEDKAEAP